MCDSFINNPEKGKPPIVKYPEECWFCGSCLLLSTLRSAGFVVPVSPTVLIKRRERYG
jgi:hypothetical protein